MARQDYNNTEPKVREEKSQYEEMLERINLQSIGYFVKEGSENLNVKKLIFRKGKILQTQN